MGGAAGHMMHLWEDTSLTFQDIINIANSIQNKTIKCIEKLDGQNIFLSIKDNTPIFARTKAQMKNFGENSNIDSYEFFSEKTPDKIVDTYNEVLKSFGSKVNYDFFEDGKIWINAEILSTKTENIIIYNLEGIFIHEIIRIDENVNTLEHINIDDFLNTQLNNNEIIFNLYKSKSIDKINEFNLDDIVSKLKHFSYNSLSDKICSIIEYKFYKSLEFECDGVLKEETKKRLAYRWAFKDKSYNIRNIYNNEPKEYKKDISLLDKTFMEKRKKFMYPIIQIISELGVKILKNIPFSELTSKVESLDSLKNKINNYTMLASDKGAFFNVSFIDNYTLYVSLKGFDSLAQIEGIVINYNNKTYKIQGSFPFILQMVGYVKFN